ncbi:MAG: hypothetical protein J7L15_01060 [Clostridiales bacterium]|nr:hypothetical protein [Clostridiales bacterium]
MAIYEFDDYDYDDCKKIRDALGTLEGYGLENEEMLRELRDYIRKKEEEAY